MNSECETSNIDAFIEESIQLTSRYVGLVCSASRSHFLTGHHSYHNGYGTLDVIDHGDALYHGSCNYPLRIWSVTISLHKIVRMFFSQRPVCVFKNKICQFYNAYYSGRSPLSQ